MSNENAPRKYMLVDLFSGSYTEEYIGYEIFNLERNSVTDKFYGYVPPYDDPNILELGASRKDPFVEGITVIFVRKTPDASNNRMVIGFYPSARIYKKKRSGEGLNRAFKDTDGSIQEASYSMESEEYCSVPSESSLIIETRKYNPYMFRRQRIYAGKYPELDAIIYDYIDRLVDGEKQGDNVIAQQELQGIPEASEEVVRKAPRRKIQFENQTSGKRILRNPPLVKSAIIAAKYQCEVDPEHRTFKNRYDQPYMEGHHLIPCTIENAEEIWKAFNRNIDCVENIVSLCPTCHRAIHLGNQDEKRRILAILISRCLPNLKRVGINITEEYLLRLYGVVF